MPLVGIHVLLICGVLTGLLVQLYTVAHHRMRTAADCVPLYDNIKLIFWGGESILRLFGPLPTLTQDFIANLSLSVISIAAPIVAHCSGASWCGATYRVRRH